MERVVRTAFRLSLCIGFVSLAACNEEKAVAVQTMANDLVASVVQIETRLDLYWGNFQPATGALDKQAQINGLASYLINHREEIAAFGDEAAEVTADDDAGTDEDTAAREPLSENGVLETIMGVPRAMDGIDATRNDNPYASGIGNIRRRAEAVKDAVQYLDKGSYFAADAVARLETLLHSIAEDLLTLEDNVRDIADTVDAVNREDGVDFIAPSRNILAAVRDGNPTEANLRTIIATEIEQGFAARAARSQSREELSARILTTARIALDMAEATGEYRKLDWGSLMAMMDDLSALASAIELPEKYQVAITETRGDLKERIASIRSLTDAPSQ